MTVRISIHSCSTASIVVRIDIDTKTITTTTIGAITATIKSKSTNNLLNNVYVPVGPSPTRQYNIKQVLVLRQIKLTSHQPDFHTNRAEMITTTSIHIGINDPDRGPNLAHVICHIHALDQTATNVVERLSSRVIIVGKTH